VNVPARARKVAATGPRGVVASALAVAGVRRLLLLELRPDEFPPTPADGHSVVEIGAEEAAAFAPEWRGGEAEARIASGARCFAISDGQNLLAAWWHAGARTKLDYVGSPLRTGPGAVYIYDMITAPEVRGGGVAALATGLNRDLLGEQGITQELGSVLPENSSAYVAFARGGWRPVAVIASVCGHDLGARSNRLAMALARPPHMAQPLAARVRRLRDPVAGVVPGSWWGAVPSTRRMRPNDPVRTIVLHHTARPAASLRTVRAEADYMRALEHAHLVQGGWAIGYHHVVMPSGRVFEGRPPGVVGSHAKGHDAGTLGVAVAGDFEIERPTPEALRALDELLGGLPDVPVAPHRELAATQCPGRHLMAARSEPAGVEAVTT